MSNKSVSKSLGVVAIVAAALSLFSGPAFAGVVVYEEGDKKIEVGGRIQLQYYREDPDGGETTDDLFFRRLRPYISGTVTENWNGKIQFDFGKASGDNEIAVKDAYMQYTGWKNRKLTIGNKKPFFSREFLTSSKRQQLVERTFVGDHNFGSPDRALGFHFEGKNDNKKVQYGVSLASASIDPDAKKLDFDTPVNRSSDWNEGWLASGRVDFYPAGDFKMEQGDFKRGAFKWGIGLAAFTWSNDDDNNTRTSGGGSTSSSKPDVDSATGIEISGAVRGGGFSLDAQVNLLEADAVDGSFSGGVFANGTSKIDTYAVEGGYMFVPSKWEVVFGIESLEADSYANAWERTSVGINYFYNKYKVRTSFTYRMGENVNGVTGSDLDEAFLQFQFVF